MKAAYPLGFDSDVEGSAHEGQNHPNQFRPEFFRPLMGRWGYQLLFPLLWGKIPADRQLERLSFFRQGWRIQSRWQQSGL